MAKEFLIGGEWRGRGRESFASINPFDGSVAAEVAIASAEDVNDAVGSARKAVDDGVWRAMPAHKRARLLHRMADLIDTNVDLLADLQTSDNGKPLVESRGQAAASADFFRYFASVCETIESEVIPSRGPYFAFTSYEPVGVVAAIAPWNSPLTLEAQKLAPALAAGNAVVLKSSEITPQVGLEYGRLALEAGFPAGIVNVVTGMGDVGRALVEHPGVDMITFTGGTSTGRAIATAAGKRGAPVLLELGGKSPNIVFDDANVDKAIAGALVAIFHNAGQSCNAGSRLFVQRGIYDRFIDAFVQATSRLVLGDPKVAGTDIGPLSSLGHRDRVEAMLQKASTGGARVLIGGKRPAGDRFSKGAFLTPAIVALDNSHVLAREEIFGPVLCVSAFDTEEEAVQLANDTEFGLAAGLWTESFPRAMRVGERINTGTVWVNLYKVNAVNVPFGGNKASGYGRECGIQGMRAYMTEKSYYFDRSDRPGQWPASLRESAQ